MMRLSCLAFFIFLSTVAHAVTPKAGVWRFELRYPNVSIPFLIELEPGRRGWSGTLINGAERIPLEEIRVAKGRWIIPLQTYQNHLELDIRSKTTISGHFVKSSKKPEERIPLYGVHGAFRRFNRVVNKPTVDLSGKWSMEMTGSDGSKSMAIALFDQTGATLTASILTPTGDYRYIDGVAFGTEFETAAFDGVFNFIFKGKLEGDVLTGVIASKTVTKFTARRDANAALPDPYKQTTVESINFSMPDPETGKNVSLSDPAYVGKPVVIQIFGSWCPNCIDELGFLAPWYTANKSRGIEVVALSFERAPTAAEARMHLAKVVKKRAIPYPVLLAGTSSEDTPNVKLGIKNFISFPTTIFLNKKHEVYKVHTGFNGPGTGIFYEEFRKSFNTTVDELLK